MRVISLCVLAGTLICVTSERHSLTYIYTALSKPVERPGIHEFTAMGLLDTKMIDYFDSDLQEKVPKKDWMKEKLNPDYWTKGTESRKSKQQWFKVNLDILKDRMNQTDDDVHVLQWMHGCEADLVPDDSAPSGERLQFQRGIDQYSYDGNSFLYFDDDYGVWVAAAPAAMPTKRKWDEVQVLKDYTKGYLEKECLNWLEKFMDYGKAQLQHAAPPKVYMFASKSKVKSNVLLTCMATGFYPPDIVLNIKRNGRVLNEEDGVMTTGIRPNEDDTYQRRDSIEILRTDTANYTCEVNHAATNVNIEEPWDHVLPKLEDDVGGGPGGAVVGGVIGGLLVVLVGALVTFMLVKRRQNVPNEPPGRVIVAEDRPVENNPPEDNPLIPENNPLILQNDGGSSGRGSSKGSPDGSSEFLHKDGAGSQKSSDSALGSGDESTPLNSAGGESGGSKETV